MCICTGHLHDTQKQSLHVWEWGGGSWRIPAAVWVAVGYICCVLCCCCYRHQQILLWYHYNTKSGYCTHCIYSHISKSSSFLQTFLSCKQHFVSRNKVLLYPWEYEWFSTFLEQLSTLKERKLHNKLWHDIIGNKKSFRSMFHNEPWWISEFFKKVSHQTGSEVLSDCGYELAPSLNSSWRPFGLVQHWSVENLKCLLKGDMCREKNEVHWSEGQWRKATPGGAASGPFFSSAGVLVLMWVMALWSRSLLEDWGGSHKKAMSLCPLCDTLHLSGEPSQMQPKNPQYWSQTPCSPVTIETRRILNEKEEQ